MLDADVKPRFSLLISFWLVWLGVQETLFRDLNAVHHAIRRDPESQLRPVATGVDDGKNAASAYTVSLGTKTFEQLRWQYRDALVSASKEIRYVCYVCPLCVSLSCNPSMC